MQFADVHEAVMLALMCCYIAGIGIWLCIGGLFYRGFALFRWCCFAPLWPLLVIKTFVVDYYLSRRELQRRIRGYIPKEWKK